MGQLTEAERHRLQLAERTLTLEGMRAMGKWTEQQKGEIRRQVQQEFAGPENRHRLMKLRSGRTSRISGLLRRLAEWAS